eukprot:GHUV01018554.1.p1 GENE.GHUV01018554.1~~GHUV01018554.1.p1  ORF type:complete len:128 (-),score=29.52 GHUV01018554.1:181-564(-)
MPYGLQQKRQQQKAAIRKKVCESIDTLLCSWSTAAASTNVFTGHYPADTVVQKCRCLSLPDSSAAARSCIQPSPALPSLPKLIQPTCIKPIAVTTHTAAKVLLLCLTEQTVRVSSSHHSALPGSCCI